MFIVVKQIGVTASVTAYTTKRNNAVRIRLVCEVLNIGFWEDTSFKSLPNIFRIETIAIPIEATSSALKKRCRTEISFVSRVIKATVSARKRMLAI